jgi:hypothetical protein
VASVDTHASCTPRDTSSSHLSLAHSSFASEIGPFQYYAYSFVLHMEARPAQCLRGIRLRSPFPIVKSSLMHLSVDLSEDFCHFSESPIDL